MGKIMGLIGFVISMASDLYVVGTSEDGAQITAEALYLVARDINGYQWRHNHTCATCTESWETDPDDGYQCFPSTLKEDQEAAVLLSAAIRRRGNINLDHWTEIPPVYGAEAYRANWAENEAALDKY